MVPLNSLVCATFTDFEKLDVSCFFLELHAHLNGSLSRKTLTELGCLTSSTHEYQLLEHPNRNLEQCFDLFKVAHNLTRTTTAVYKATKDVIEEFAADNVIYLELRTTPRSEENMTKIEYIESVIKAIKDISSDKIIVKLLLSIDRRHDFETSSKTMDLIMEMKEKYPEIVRGVDLSGNPAQGTFYPELFSKARRKGLAISLHCGEVKNDREVMEMLKIKPERIGHATNLHPNYGGSPDIWNLYQLLQIPIECCLTSNVICKTSKSYKDHHVQEWIKHFLPFSLNTDDKGVFDTLLSKELLHAAESFNLTHKDLWSISYSSIGYVFASEAEKATLRRKLEDWALTKKL